MMQPDVGCKASLSSVAKAGVCLVRRTTSYLSKLPHPIEIVEELIAVVAVTSTLLETLEASLLRFPNLHLSQNSFITPLCIDIIFAFSELEKRVEDAIRTKIFEPNDVGLVRVPNSAWALLLGGKENCQALRNRLYIEKYRARVLFDAFRWTSLSSLAKKTAHEEEELRELQKMLPIIADRILRIMHDSSHIDDQQVNKTKQKKFRIAEKFERIVKRDPFTHFVRREEPKIPINEAQHSLHRATKVPHSTDIPPKIQIMQPEQLTVLVEALQNIRLPPSLRSQTRTLHEANISLPLLWPGSFLQQEGDFLGLLTGCAICLPFRASTQYNDYSASPSRITLPKTQRHTRIERRENKTSWFDHEDKARLYRSVFSSSRFTNLRCIADNLAGVFGIFVKNKIWCTALCMCSRPGVVAGLSPEAASSTSISYIDTTVLGVTIAVTFLGVRYLEQRFRSDILLITSIVVNSGLLYLVMDRTIQADQIVGGWMLGKSLNIALLNDKLLRFPRTRAATMLVIFASGVGTAGGIVYSLPEIEQGCSDSRVLVAVGSLLATSAWTFFWIALVRNFGVADKLERGDFDGAIGAYIRHIFDAWINRFIARLFESLLDHIFEDREAGFRYNMPRYQTREIVRDLEDNFPTQEPFIRLRTNDSPVNERREL